MRKVGNGKNGNAKTLRHVLRDVIRSQRRNAQTGTGLTEAVDVPLLQWTSILILKCSNRYGASWFSESVDVLCYLSRKKN